MEHTISTEEVALLADIAGGFDYNRIGVPLAPRFVASVSWEKADKLRELVLRLTKPVVSPPLPPPTGAAQLLAWGDYTRKLVNLGNTPVSWQFTVPATVKGYGHITFAEFQGPPYPREMTLTDTVGNFTPTDGRYGAGTTPLISYFVGEGGDPSWARLEPNNTYYINVRNYGMVDRDYQSALEVSWPQP